MNAGLSALVLLIVWITRFCKQPLSPDNPYKVLEKLVHKFPWNR